MKKILLILVAVIGIGINTNIYAQKEKIVLCLEELKDKWKFEDESIIIQKVINVNDISKENLYKYLREFFIYNYGSARDVIQYDEVNETIIGKGYYSKLESYGDYFDVWHILKCEIRENRIRITLSMKEMLVYDEPNAAEQYFLGKRGVDISKKYFVNFYPMDLSSFNKTRTQEGWVVCQSVNKALFTIIEIEKFIKNTSERSKKQDDW